MFGLTLIEKLLFCLDLGATLALLLRLFFSGLYRIYPLFFAFLSVSLCGEIGIATQHSGTDRYAYWFIGVEAVRTIFSAVIVVDLYSLVLKDLTELASMAKRYFSIVLGTSIVASLLLLSLEQSPSSTLLKYYVFHRAISTSLVLFILLITGFLVYYPIPLARPVIVSPLGSADSFLAHAAGFLLITTGGPDQAWRDPVSKILQFVSFATLICWGIFLNRAGETNIRAAVPRPDPQQARQILQRLEAMNASLVRVGKKP